MRKFIYLLTSFVALVLFTINASYAEYDPNPKHSKWFHDSIVNDPLTKSTVNVEAQRSYPVTVTNPANAERDTITKVQKSSIKVPANVAAVGKQLLKGGAQVAIASAVLAIVGKAVDWVLDPANNSITYTDDSSAPSYDHPSNPSYYEARISGVTLARSTVRSTAADAACIAKYGSEASGHSVNDYNFGCYSSGTKAAQGGAFLFVSNPAYDPNVSVPSSRRSIPIDTVSQKVIDHADAGEEAAMEVMNNTALDSLEQGLLDSQLEAAAQPKSFGANESNPLGNTDPNPTDPTDPTDPTPEPETSNFQLPPFCSWATKVCGFIDWMQTPPDEPDESGDIEVQLPDADMHVPILERLYIDMPAACPADPILEFMGAKIPFPMSIFCQFAEMMKPLILLFAYIKGLSIIGNGLT